MNIKPITVLFSLLFMTAITPMSYADNHDGPMDHTTHHNMASTIDDGRISLGLSPKMKQHQLSNMRSHLEAVQAIIGLIAEGKFETASNIAHSKLGLTNEMNAMCNMIENEDFKKIGLSFHKSGDALGDALLSNDINISLNALHTTMGSCIQCHAKFRQ